jgi:hypothetical protein
MVISLNLILLWFWFKFLIDNIEPSKKVKLPEIGINILFYDSNGLIELKNDISIEFI